jgi:hypothetical protein
MYHNLRYYYITVGFIKKITVLWDGLSTVKDAATNFSKNSVYFCEIMWRHKAWVRKLRSHEGARSHNVLPNYKYGKKIYRVSQNLLWQDYTNVPMKHYFICNQTSLQGVSWGNINIFGGNGISHWQKRKSMWTYVQFWLVTEKELFESMNKRALWEINE